MVEPGNNTSSVKKLQARIKASANTRREGEDRLEAMSHIVEEFKHELEASRTKYCEHFLPADCQKICHVNDAVRDRMIEGWFKLNRQNYFQDYWSYTIDMTTWRNLQGFQESVILPTSPKMHIYLKNTESPMSDNKPLLVSAPAQLRNDAQDIIDLIPEGADDLSKNLNIKFPCVMKCLEP